MAPEALSEESYGVKADIWSLAITAIQVADGKPPLSELSVGRAMLAIIHGPPPALKDPKKWSKEFNDFLAVCLRKNPDERPEAEELLKHPFLMQVKDGHTLSFLKDYRMKVRERPALERTFSVINMQSNQTPGFPQPYSPSAELIKQSILADTNKPSRASLEMSQPLAISGIINSPLNAPPSSYIGPQQSLPGDANSTSSNQQPMVGPPDQSGANKPSEASPSTEKRPSPFVRAGTGDLRPTSRRSSFSVSSLPEGKVEPPVRPGTSYINLPLAFPEPSALHKNEKSSTTRKSQEIKNNEIEPEGGPKQKTGSDEATIDLLQNNGQLEELVSILKDLLANERLRVRDATEEVAKWKKIANSLQRELDEIKLSHALSTSSDNVDHM